MAESTTEQAVLLVLTAHEGRKLHVYEDIYGIPTIGVGFNLTRPDASKICNDCGADYHALVGGTKDLTDDQCDYITKQLVNDVVVWIAKIFPGFSAFSTNRQVALIDMGFNLGQTRFSQFKQMIAAIKAGDWQQASSHALDSEWAKQVPSRAHQDAAWLLVG